MGNSSKQNMCICNFRQLFKAKHAGLLLVTFERKVFATFGNFSKSKYVDSKLLKAKHVES
jgi:hypothetical protein